MTRVQALDILCAFQAWRRYDGPIGEGPIMPAPREIGEAIDIAIEVLQAKEAPQVETKRPTGWTIEQLREKELIDEEGLSRRALNCLRAADIYTVWDLAGWSRYKITRIRNFGKLSFKEAEGVLMKYGISWGMYESEACKNWKWR